MKSHREGRVGKVSQHLQHGADRGGWRIREDAVTTYLVAQTRTLWRVKGKLSIVTLNNRCKQRPLWAKHAICALVEARRDGAMSMCCGGGGAGLAWQVGACVRSVFWRARSPGVSSGVGACGASWQDSSRTRSALGATALAMMGRKVWRDTEQRRETRPEQGHRPEDRDKTGGETQNRRGTPDWRRETRLEVHAEACSRMQGRVPKETYPLGAPEVALMEGQRGEGRNGWRSRSQPRRLVASAGDKQRMPSADSQSLPQGADTGSWTSQGQVPSQAGNPRAESSHPRGQHRWKRGVRWLTGPREAHEGEALKQMGSGAGTEGGLVSHWAIGVPGEFVASTS